MIEGRREVTSGDGDGEERSAGGIDVGTSEGSAVVTRSTTGAEIESASATGGAEEGASASGVDGESAVAEAGGASRIGAEVEADACTEVQTTAETL